MHQVQGPWIASVFLCDRFVKATTSEREGGSDARKASVIERAPMGRLMPELQKSVPADPTPSPQP